MERKLLYLSYIAIHLLVYFICERKYTVLLDQSNMQSDQTNYFVEKCQHLPPRIRFPVFLCYCTSAGKRNRFLWCLNDKQICTSVMHHTKQMCITCDFLFFVFLLCLTSFGHTHLITRLNVHASMSATVSYHCKRIILVQGHIVIMCTVYCMRTDSGLKILIAVMQIKYLWGCVAPAVVRYIEGGCFLRVKQFQRDGFTANRCGIISTVENEN